MGPASIPQHSFGASAPACASMAARIACGMMSRGLVDGITHPPDNTHMARDKVILAYSGGLDTSVMVPWIGEHYGMDVVTFTVDLGQCEDINKIKQKATRTGAVDA